MSNVVILKGGFSKKQQESITRAAPQIARALAALGLDDFDVMVYKMENPRDPSLPEASASVNKTTKRVLVCLNAANGKVSGGPATVLWLEGRHSLQEIIVEAIVTSYFSGAHVYTLTSMSLAIARLVSDRLEGLAEEMFGRGDEPVGDVMPPADDQVN